MLETEEINKIVKEESLEIAGRGQQDTPEMASFREKVRADIAKQRASGLAVDMAKE